jgi:hypothetical protein
VTLLGTANGPDRHPGALGKLGLSQPGGTAPRCQLVAEQSDVGVGGRRGHYTP